MPDLLKQAELSPICMAFKASVRVLLFL